MPESGEDELATLAASFNGMADSLQARIRELAELSVMQQRFVSDVSHELRTPLTTIRLAGRSAEHTSELQSLMRISYAVFCLHKKNKTCTNMNMRQSIHYSSE